MFVLNENAKVAVILLVSALVTFSNGATTTTTYLTAADQNRLQQVFTSALDTKDLSSTHYAVLGFKLLGVPVPNAKEICKFLVESSTSATTAEANYYVGSTWQALGTCQGAFPAANIVKTLNGVLDQEGSSVADLYYAVQGLKNLGQKLADPVKITKALQLALKKDDSVSSLGYLFHAGAALGGDVSFVFNHIEDAVVQADEVDGRFLQFEGGLSITALVVSGAYKIAAVANKPPPITGEQAVKFANYFLSRRSVQTSKGAFNLLEIVTALTDNKYHIPVVISQAGPGVVSIEQPRVSVRVTNLLGKPLTTDPVTVTVESATRVSDDVVVISKKRFDPQAEATLYAVNLMEAKPEPGLYKLSVNAVPIKPDPRWVGNIGVVLSLKVMCAAVVESFEIGTGDADQSTQPKFEKVVYPNKMTQVIEIDALQKLVIKFTLKDKASGKTLNVHQAFLRFSNAATDQEIIFVADPDSNNNYRFELDVGSKAADFGQLSGLYSLQLIVGDVILSNSFEWDVADVQLKLALDPSQAPKLDSMYKPKPEIKHMFREPERRPPVIVSNLFTGLVAVPFLVLLVLWAKLGINISNFPFSLSAIGFHLGLAGIFALFGCFWLKLNMFQTLKYLFGLGVITFLCGNRMLAKIARNRKSH